MYRLYKKVTKNEIKKKKNRNGMIQITCLKKAVYCEHWHYHYTYTRGTKNNVLTRNLNEV
jgi:hypothetical protein